MYTKELSLVYDAAKSLALRPPFPNVKHVTLTTPTVFFMQRFGLLFGSGVESFVMDHALQEVGVRGRPDDHDGEETEDEGPRPHDVAHAIGRALAEREFLTR